MTETSKILSIIAYYLSEYDIDAVHALGYHTRKEAFERLSSHFERENNYLKLRRDEFDALPESSSNRNGWNKRAAAKDVISLAAYLRQFSFEELTDLVTALIQNKQNLDNKETVFSTVSEAEMEAKSYSEEELEQIINFTDEGATVKIKTGSKSVRIYDPKIIFELKQLYHGRCQICNCRPLDLSVDICEAHHIDYFAKSHNNNASNIIILCPDHHRAIHKLKPVFDAKRLSFIYPDGKEELVKLNFHL
jgi:predicted restriction endonuclease